MTERPIIFSAPMVRAIFEGRKTQTRRVVQPKPTHRIVEGLAHVTVGMDPADDGLDLYDADGIGPGRLVRCLYGGPGDRLRERIKLVLSGEPDWIGTLRLALEGR